MLNLAKRLLNSGYYVVVGDENYYIYHSKKGYHNDPSNPELQNVNADTDKFFNKPAKFKLKNGDKEQSELLYYYMLPDYIKGVKAGKSVEDYYENISYQEARRYLTKQQVKDLYNNPKTNIYMQIGNVGYMIHSHNGKDLRMMKVSKLNDFRRAGVLV